MVVNSVRVVVSLLWLMISRLQKILCIIIVRSVMINALHRLFDLVL